MKTVVWVVVWVGGCVCGGGTQRGRENTNVCKVYMRKRTMRV